MTECASGRQHVVESGKKGIWEFMKFMVTK